MRLLHGLTLAAALSGALPAADPPASPFVFPTQPVAPVPPAPQPGAVLSLTSDTLYVVSSKVDASVRGYPAGLVTVTKETGPLRVRGRFIDGSGKVQTRTFPGPFVFVVEAAGTGRVDLVVTPLGLKSDGEIETRQLDVDAGQGPIPPPKPVPPTPKPDPVTSFRVILVYESADTLTAAQRGVVFGKAVEDYLNVNCTGGKGGWRRRDKDAPGENDPTMAALWAAVKPNVTVTPCVVVERNGKVEIINVDATPAKMIETLQTYKGK